MKNEEFERIASAHAETQVELQRAKSTHNELSSQATLANELRLTVQKLEAELETNEAESKAVKQQCEGLKASMEKLQYEAAQQRNIDRERIETLTKLNVTLNADKSKLYDELREKEAKLAEKDLALLKYQFTPETDTTGTERLRIENKMLSEQLAKVLLSE